MDSGVNGLSGRSDYRLGNPLADARRGNLKRGRA